MQDYIFLSVGRVGSSTELIKQEVLRVDANEKQLILIDLLSTVQESLTVGGEKKVRLHASYFTPKLCKALQELLMLVVLKLTKRSSKARDFIILLQCEAAVCSGK